jgi:hypothetical protein
MITSLANLKDVLVQIGNDSNLLGIEFSTFRIENISADISAKSKPSILVRDMGTMTGIDPFNYARIWPATVPVKRRIFHICFPKM